MNIKTVLGLLILVLSTTVSAESSLYFRGVSGVSIFGMGTLTLTDADGPITVSRSQTNKIEVVYGNILSSASRELEFEAPFGEPLKVDNYEDAFHATFNRWNQPGMFIHGEGRACDSYGRFDVLEIEYDADGEVVKLALDYVHRCPSNGDSTMYGAIRINSTIPLLLEEPLAVAGAEQWVNENDQVQLDGSNSNSGLGTSRSYTWTQTGGPDVQLSNPNSSKPTFVAPTGIALGGETITFNLALSNELGASDEDTVDIHIASKSDPVTYFHYWKTIDGLVDFDNTVNIHNAVLKTQKVFDNDISISFYLGRTAWIDAWFFVPDGQTLTPGNYETTTNRGTDDPTILAFDTSLSTCTQKLINVDQIAFAEDGELASFATDFHTNCASSSIVWFGEIRYNYLAPNIPVAKAGNDQNAAKGATVTLDASTSTDDSGAIASYAWQQIEGTPVTLMNADTSQAQFTVPADIADPVLVFEVVVTDDEGFQHSDQVAININGNQSGKGGGGSSGSGGGGLSLFMLVLLVVRRAMCAFIKSPAPMQA